LQVRQEVVEDKRKRKEEKAQLEELNAVTKEQADAYDKAAMSDEMKLLKAKGELKSGQGGGTMFL
jgi:hypothetical protein